MNGLLSSPKNVRKLILATNLVYIVSLLLKMGISNPAYFFENAFQTINLVFYGYVVISWFLIRNNKLYFLSSLLLILDLPVNLRPYIQNFLVWQLHIGNISAIHIILVFLAAVFVFIVYRYKIMPYLQVFLLFFYSVSLLFIIFQTKTVRSTALHISTPVGNISKNYYFLLFDEYPGEQIIKQYDLCEKADYPSSFLPRQGFAADPRFYTNYISTVRSSINFLTGSMQARYNVNNAINALDSNVFAKGSNYSFAAFSILDRNNRPNSFFARYYFYNFNNLLTQKVIPWCISLFSTRHVGDFNDCELYNADAFGKLEELSKSKRLHVAYIHFFAPHTYPLVRDVPIAKRIHNANEWMLRSIAAITRNDPKAGVVIFSDHGLREPPVPFSQWNQGLLYSRQVTIDTAKLNRSGLVSLAESIKY